MTTSTAPLLGFGPRPLPTSSPRDFRLDLEALATALDYWRRGDHAEALHWLERALPDFHGLADLKVTT